jgi:hypothetical protein
MTTDQARKLLNNLPEERKRKPIPSKILKKVFKEVDKIKTIPFKRKDWKDIFWSDNPIKDELPLTIDIPIIEIDDITYNKDFKHKPIFYDEDTIKKEGIKYVNSSCIITYKGEIMIVYITEQTDKAITKATEKLVELGEQMNMYYPVKSHSFYTPFKLTNKNSTKKEKDEAHILKQQQLTNDRYNGYNWMDGMIRYYKGTTNQKNNGDVIAYQPRKVVANDDESFLYNLVYTYSSLYELEKRYAPQISKYRYNLAKDVGFVGAFPNVPLERHCSTGCGASLDFASSIHNDSGISGLTETIIWSKCKKGEHQLFVSPTLKLVFDLSNHNAIILQPPKVPHGTASTGNHNGYGYVNITKANLVSKTELTKDYYSLWKRYLHQ